MAGWTTTVWEAADWALLTNIQDFIKAYNERRVAVGAAAVDVPAAGEDVQLATFWSTVQDWLEANASSFVQSHGTDGNPYAANYYDGLATIDMWAWADVLVSADIATGWRRQTTLGSWDTPGTMQAGDIIGPWIFEDLQAVMARFVWTRYYLKAVTGNVRREASYTIAYDDPTPPFHTWAGLTGHLDALWPSVALTASESPLVAWTAGREWYAPAYEWNGAAGIHRASRQFQAVVPGAVSPAVDYYVKPIIVTRGALGTATYDGNGDFDGYEDLFKLVDTQTGYGTVTSATIGTNDAGSPPTWCAYPGASPPDGDEATSLGYEIGGSVESDGTITDGEDYCVGVIRWNNATGFVYY